MTQAVIDIYREQLAEQLGADGPHTQKAVIDPGGVDQEIYGWFEDTDYVSNKDSGNVQQFNRRRRFITAGSITVDPYANTELRIEETGELFTINKISFDGSGVSVLWLV